jgi:hypothetical protein
MNYQIFAAFKSSQLIGFLLMAKCMHCLLESPKQVASHVTCIKLTSCELPRLDDVIESVPRNPFSWFHKNAEIRSSNNCSVVVHCLSNNWDKFKRLTSASENAHGHTI